MMEKKEQNFVFEQWRKMKKGKSERMELKEEGLYVIKKITGTKTNAKKFA